MKKKSWLPWAAVGASLALAACGGGGGGGDDDGPSEPGLISSRASLSFVGFTGVPVPAQTVSFTLIGGSQKYYARILLDDASRVSGAYASTGDTSGIVTITPVALPLGASRGSFEFQLCRDVWCSSIATTKTIAYSWTVFQIDSSGVVASGAQGGADVSQTLAVNPPDTGHLLRVRSDPAISASWLSPAMDVDGNIGVGLSTSGLSQATYQSNLLIDFASNSSSPVLTVPVSLSVLAN